MIDILQFFSNSINSYNQISEKLGYLLVLKPSGNSGKKNSTSMIKFESRSNIMPSAFNTFLSHRYDAVGMADPVIFFLGLL